LPDARTAWYVCLSTACRGRATPGCRVHASGAPPRTVACARDNVQPSQETPHPTPVGALWPTQPERARLCMHARMHARRCSSQRPAAKEEAHAFARLPKGCKLCALCSRNASSRTGTRTVRNGRGRRWGGLSHAKGQGHHRRASARDRTGLAGRIRPNFFSDSFPPPLPCHGVRARESGSDDGEEGKSLPENGDFPGSLRFDPRCWLLAAALRAQRSRRH
jgi:hypothetical protein